MCLISSSSDSLLPVVSVKPLSSLVGILSSSPVTFFYSLHPADAWGALGHLHRCPLQPCTLQSSCFPLRTQLSILWLFPALYCRQQAQIFVQNLLQRCGSPCLWAGSVGIEPENTRKWEQAAPLSGTAGF